MGVGGISEGLVALKDRRRWLGGHTPQTKRMRTIDHERLVGYYKIDDSLLRQIAVVFLENVLRCEVAAPTS